MNDSIVDTDFDIEDEPAMTRAEQLDFMTGDFIRAAQFTQEDRETIVENLIELHGSQPQLAAEMVRQMVRARRQWDVITQTARARINGKED